MQLYILWIASLAEWSKAVDLSPTISGCAGSNPARCIALLAQLVRAWVLCAQGHEFKPRKEQYIIIYKINCNCFYKLYLLYIKRCFCLMKI
jgi:hypothetical protein